MSKAEDEDESLACMGILGRAMARARGRGGAERSESHAGDAPTSRTTSATTPGAARVTPASRHLGVLVGADGVLMGGRFIDYSDVSDIRHESREHPGWSWGDAGGESTVTWRVSLRLTDNRVVNLTEDLETGHGAVEVHSLAYAIESAHEAWLALVKQPRPDVDTLARGERSATAWLEALQQRASPALGPYRRPSVDLDWMSRILDDARAEPWARAAAAIVLMSSGDRSAAEKLRAVSHALAHPVVSAALRSVAEATDDGAVAAALDALQPVNVAGHQGMELDVGDGPP